MYFWIYQIFWNIAVSQGNAATSIRYDGLYNTNFVENIFLSLPVKELENWSIFREVIDMSKVSCFFCLTVYIRTLVGDLKHRWNAAESTALGVLL